MTKQSNFIRCLAIGALLAGLPGVSSVLHGEEITHSVSDSGEVWRIDEPTVTQAQTNYTQIVFQANDGVIVTAGGCVQTGGSGLTWKRYIDPQGPNSDHLYHGLIQLPGVQTGLVRIGTVVTTAFTMPAQTPGQNFLRLGYEDDNYPDNGYSNHDDGTGDQCKDVGPAYVVVTILHNVAPEEWVSIGPDGIPLSNNDVVSGQANALVIHPQDFNTVYVGASEGGVWKTTDGGTTWSQLTDVDLVRTLNSGQKRGTLSIASLAIDPNHPNTVYAGTGEPNLACCFAGPSLGVFRSADGGGTWAPTGNFLNDPKCDNLAMSTAKVNRLLTSETSTTTLYAATDAGVFAYKEDTTDCWKRLGTGLPAGGNAIDMAADHFHNALYAGVWGKGIYKYDLTAGGAWTLLTGGLPASGFGRIALAFGGRGATPQPLLYAGIDFTTTSTNVVYRLFKTVDGGTTWSERPMPPADGQLNFNNAIEVGADPNEVYIGQVNLWRATDGGVIGGENDYTTGVTNHSWTRMSCCLADSNPFRKGLDLHSDFHQIAFAPAGSFVSDPTQVEIVYVVNDGGITRGFVDSKGVVTWQAITFGLTIGQCGTLGLNPNNQLQTLCGLWHNSNAFIDAGLSQSVQVGGGDGFQTSIDAATAIPTMVYFNCNSGFGGSVCRATVSQSPAIEEASAAETIWNTTNSTTTWSDPYRAGSLLRLELGVVSRVPSANTATAASLLASGAWSFVDPSPGKTGKTTTLAFGIPSLLGIKTPVYYLGTDTGQIWRGSPEAGWTKLCECSLQVSAIAPFLSTPEKIYAVFKGNGPGRIKQLVRQTNGTWTVTNIDSAFTPDLQVVTTFSIAVDPADSAGNTVFVGTDQGLYRGQLSGTAWSWTRGLGVPNVWVTDLEVNQGNVATGQTDVVRAATYGRGVFERRRFTVRDMFVTPSRPQEVLGLHVQAIQVLEDGAPPALGVKIPVAFLKTAKKAERQKTPFWVTQAQGTEVLLEAPLEIQGEGGVTLKFIGWALPGGRSESQPRVSLQIEGRMNAVAYYQLSDPDERREEHERERD